MLPAFASGPRVSCPAQTIYVPCVLHGIANQTCRPYPSAPFLSAPSPRDPVSTPISPVASLTPCGPSRLSSSIPTTTKTEQTYSRSSPFPRTSHPRVRITIPAQGAAWQSAFDLAYKAATTSCSASASSTDLLSKPASVKRSGETYL